MRRQKQGGQQIEVANEWIVEIEWEKREGRRKKKKEKIK